MRHGGELEECRSRIEIDFSVNINPLGMPEEIIEAVKEAVPELMRYPDQECRLLCQALSDKLQVQKENLICGNGASELIQCLFLGLKPGKVLLTAPSFSGYGWAAKAAGSEIVYHYLKKENEFSLGKDYLDSLDRERPGLAVLCSPANPVGNRIDRGLLQEIVDKCVNEGIYLLMDECFTGFLPDEETYSLRNIYREDGGLPARQRVFVLDAFTKRYAIPGIRLGYMLCGNQEVSARIKELKCEWSVSVAANAAGLAALRVPSAYIEKARELISGERVFMESALEGLGFKTYRGEANYIFFETGKDIFDPLLERGLLIRHCGNYEGLDGRFYRAALLSHEKNIRLIEALEEIVKEVQNG